MSRNRRKSVLAIPEMSREEKMLIAEVKREAAKKPAPMKEGSPALEERRRVNRLITYFMEKSKPEMHTEGIHDMMIRQKQTSPDLPPHRASVETTQGASKLDIVFVERFMHLFRGNIRSHGEFQPDNGSMRTVHTSPDMDCFVDHLVGKTGVGVVPILDDGTCYWGAIDIDNHGSKKDSDIESIVKRVGALRLPLVACRSKSGGVHLYLFGLEPMSAVLVRKTLTIWATTLGIEGVDCIFPKQDKLLKDDDGEIQYGNWVNLPYFNGDDGDRRCFDPGDKILTLDMFLMYAESKRITQTQLSSLFDRLHTEAPPCIQHGIMHGVDIGGRNEWMYNASVYMKKYAPKEWRDKIDVINDSVLAIPIDKIELKSIKNSVSSKDYRYKCEVEPCKSWCNKQLCLTKKFGITSKESESTVGILPPFKLVRWMEPNTREGKWQVNFDGFSLFMSHEEVTSSYMFCRVVGFQLGKAYHVPKQSEWIDFINTKMEGAPVEESAPGVSIPGMARQMLIDYLRKADFSSPDNQKVRVDLLRGQPVAQMHGHCIPKEVVIWFRHSGFVDYLKKNHREEMKADRLWSDVYVPMGAEKGRISVRVGTERVVIDAYRMSKREFIKHQGELEDDITHEFENEY